MMTIEAAAIQVAEAYAKANGSPGKDAAGLVLVGMVIGALCSERTRESIVLGYLRQNPAAVTPTLRWAKHIDRAEP